MNGSDEQATALAATAGDRLQRAWKGGEDAIRDASDAADLYRRAAELSAAGSAARLAYLGNLGLALRELWELTEDPDALDDTVHVLEIAVKESAPDTRDGVRSRMQLGGALRARFAASRNEQDARAAIGALSEALEHGAAIGAPGLAEVERLLGNALFDAGEDREEAIDEAIAHLRAAVKLDSDPMYASDLASALLARFDVTAEAHALAEAIELLERAAVQGTPSARLLANLGNAHAARAEFMADLDDASRAVAALRQAAELVAGVDAPGIESDLAAALLDRFSLTGQIADVDEAVERLEAAVRATPKGHRRRGARLNNLAIALRQRALRRREGRADLDRAVAAYQEALGEAGSARDLTSYRANLGNVLHQRFDITNDPADLDGALHELEIAYAQMPAGSPDRARYVNNLTATLSARADLSGRVADFQRAADLLREELDSSPPGSANRPGMLVNLGNATSELFNRLGREDDRAAAVEAYRSAAGEGLAANPADALAAAHNWSGWAAGLRAWPQVVEAHAVGQRAADRLLRAQIARADKESWLRDADGLSALAALAYANEGDRRAAVVAIEAGRGILLSERLQRGHADLRRLEAAHPELAHRYRAIVASMPAP